ncbi:hypothetical protein BDA99DRAFT_558904 [Phascolomyces articulosus]|uniref:Uncharacterized protein n=1 Tax=Phascolomyces articulosus TaxID=60185 RepID=A0AAD5K321_9FUNG|nr:hypothetical protein BDA99DRAFT_558904 [Phascolomyces articulosus]
MMLRTPLSLLSLGVILFVTTLPQQANSFCIYNKSESETEINVEQIGGADNTPWGRRFKKYNVASGNKECCAFDNSDCNDNVSEKTHPVKFRFHVAGHGTDDSGYEITGHSGRYFIVNGTKEDPHFEVFNFEHKRIEFNLKEV